MLAKDPDERPRDGAEVAAALAGDRWPVSAARVVRPVRDAATTAISGGERRVLSVVLMGRGAEPTPTALAS